jgi:mono/diheme cytochrome c family protein
MLKIKYIAIVSFVLSAAFIFLETSFMPGTITDGFISSAQTISGEDLYKNNCARCHGDKGEGDKGPNLTTKKKQEKWKDSDEKLVSKITKGGWGMPAFGKKLKADEIKSIAEYVRSLKPETVK